MPVAQKHSTVKNEISLQWSARRAARRMASNAARQVCACARKARQASAARRTCSPMWPRCFSPTPPTSSSCPSARVACSATSSAPSTSAPTRPASWYSFVLRSAFLQSHALQCNYVLSMTADFGDIGAVQGWQVVVEHECDEDEKCTRVRDVILCTWLHKEPADRCCAHSQSRYSCHWSARVYWQQQANRWTRLH